MNDELRIRLLLETLIDLEQECEWVEFKTNNDDPEQIGEYLSALSNSAALCGRDAGYLIWGVSDARQVVGTQVDPAARKVGNEQISSWLSHLLTPRIEFWFHTMDFRGSRVVVLEIQPASRQPVRFKESEFIRQGSYKKKLKDFPEKERLLWASFASSPFEAGIAASHVSGNEVLALLDTLSAFRLLRLPIPDSNAAILERLENESLIVSRGSGQFDVTNLGAIMFARDITEFQRLRRKALRVIVYRDKSRLHPTRELANVSRGYAIGFEELVRQVVDQLPQQESFGSPVRIDSPTFPNLAIRELTANCLIHQDFSVSGAGPMIEIFSDRVEFSNPGESLVDVLRLLDARPISRNEDLAAMMRRVKICEERGSGVDKVVAEVEAQLLPAPEFTSSARNTIAILYGPRPLTQMTPRERVRACYQHACLCSVSSLPMTNSSLRQRFAVASKNAAMVSRVIAETLKEGLIRLRDNESGKRYARYVPFWS